MVSSRKGSHDPADRRRTNNGPQPDESTRDQVMTTRLNARRPNRRHAVIFTPEQAEREFAAVREELAVRIAVTPDVDRAEENTSSATSGRSTPQRSPRDSAAGLEPGLVLPHVEFGLSNSEFGFNLFSSATTPLEGDQNSVDGHFDAGRESVAYAGLQFNFVYQTFTCSMICSYTIKYSDSFIMIGFTTKVDTIPTTTTI
ncbi:unnamed protein product [Amoebophrya sp. A25]|nr:unnamed protein product [Amoebophrya sp. A25]|eukprot:GSA25T00006786001.1